MNAISTHKAAVAAELDELLAEKTAVYCGDFDAWLEGEDPETVEYAFDLIDSLADVLARPLSAGDKRRRLYARWVEVWRDVQEEYAQAAAWDRERGYARPYSDRRGW